MIAQQKRMVQLSEGLQAFIEAYAADSGFIGDAEFCALVCRKEGLQDLDDLRQLAGRTWLGEKFPAKVALRMENAFDSPDFMHELEKLAPEEWRRERKRKAAWIDKFHLKTKLEVMQATCTTLGVVCALMLAMNVGSFSSMTIEEWDFYEANIGMDRCVDPDYHSFTVGKNVTQAECARKLRIASEWFFVLLNAGGICLLLLATLFCSWMYLCMSLPGAAPGRQDEEEAVVARFSGEFITLQVIFGIAMLTSCAGIGQLMQLKSSDWSLVTVVNYISLMFVLAIILIAYWLHREVFKARDIIKELRRGHSLDKDMVQGNQHSRLSQAQQHISNTLNAGSNIMKGVAAVCFNQKETRVSTQPTNGCFNA